MKLKRSYRVPVGFVAGAYYIWSAKPEIQTFIIGAMIMLFGEIIRFVSSGTLKKFEGVTRNGIYAHTRNPLYIGSLFIGLGACLIGKDPVFTLVFIIFFPVLYFQTIKREEKHLVVKYGQDYVDYIAEVPRILPKNLDLKNIFSETDPARAVKNKEMLTVYGILAIWTALIIKMVI